VHVNLDLFRYDIRLLPRDLMVAPRGEGTEVRAGEARQNKLYKLQLMKCIFYPINISFHLARRIIIKNLQINFCSFYKYISDYFLVAVSEE
jgi:hypothetical protein